MVLICGLIIGVLSMFMESSSDKELKNIGGLAGIVALILIIVGIVNLVN